MITPTLQAATAPAVPEFVRVAATKYKYGWWAYDGQTQLYVSYGSSPSRTEALSAYTEATSRPHICRGAFLEDGVATTAYHAPAQCPMPATPPAKPSWFAQHGALALLSAGVLLTLGGAAALVKTRRAGFGLGQPEDPEGLSPTEWEEYLREEERGREPHQRESWDPQGRGEAAWERETGR